VRIAAEWAGNEQGAIHLPRAGQEVLIEFMADDPERPISTGCFYNAKNPPPWKLPDQQALSGWRSRELSPGLGNALMGRSNHVLLDDTPGAMQVQAKSDHLHSSASAGAIYRIEDNKGRKEFRGEGVEVRTDGPGVVRGQAGLLATTEGRPEGQGHITDVSETAQRLHEAQQQQDQHALLAQQAGTQDAADQAEVAKALLAQAHEIGGTAGVTGNGTKDANAAADSANTADSNALPKPFPEFSAPHIVLASAAGIATTATQSTHEHSAMHHAITAAKHISLSVGQSLLASVDGAIRFLAYHAGLRIMSVTGKMEVAALDKTIRVTSALKIKQVGDTVHIEADEGVEINGGGSYSHFRDGVIEEGTAGEYVVHSNGTGTDGAQSLAVTPQVFPAYSQNACACQLCIKAASQNGSIAIKRGH
jgi:type VI secretion system secreted protein VgrG